MFGRAQKLVNKISEIQVHNQKIRELIDNYNPPEFTPDLWELEQKQAHLVFIHDDMMQLKKHHYLVEAQSRSGFYPFSFGYTARRFNFVNKNLEKESFPIALNLRETDNLPYWMADSFRIRGEVYAIRTKGIIALDNHRQNGVQFTRERVSINIGYRKRFKHTTTDSKGRSHIDYSLSREEMLTITAFMYVGREEYWTDQLQAGFFDFTPIDVVREDRLWLKEYYQYGRR